MNYFKQAREQIGATQHQMAVALGVHRQNVSNWERGTSKMPPKHIPKMVKFLTKKEFESFIENYKQYNVALAMKRIDKRLSKYVR